MIRVILYLIGLISLTLFGAWMLGMILYVFSDATYTGSVAFLPRWIFWGSGFLIFHNSKPVQRFYRKLEEVFF